MENHDLYWLVRKSYPYQHEPLATFVAIVCAATLGDLKLGGEETEAFESARILLQPAAYPKVSTIP